MWWHRFLVLTLVLGTLSGCGYRSLYGEKTHGLVREELASIEVMPIRDRVGQQLHNELRDALTPRGVSRYPRYRLRVRLNHINIDLGVRSDSLSTRGNLNMSASYTLSVVERSAGGKVKEDEIVAGEEFVVAGYNIYSSDFATLEAKKAAQGRAVREVAQGIESQLAVFLVQSKLVRGETKR